MALAFRYYLVSLSFLPFILNTTTDNDLFYCIDWNCEEFISRGKTLLNYAGKTEKHLSFRQNEDIRILGKPVDENGPDWVGTVRRKVGLVPKSMVREDQMGKKPSSFKYPLSQLPIWTQSPEIFDQPHHNEFNGTVEDSEAEDDDEEEKSETKPATGNVDQSLDLYSVGSNTTPTSMDNKEIPTSAVSSESESTESTVQSVDEFTTTTPLPYSAMPDVDAIEENQTGFNGTVEDSEDDEEEEKSETKPETGNVDQSLDLDSDTNTTPKSVDDNEVPTSAVANKSESTVQKVDEFTTTTPIPVADSAVPDVDAIEENQTGFNGTVEDSEDEDEGDKSETIPETGNDDQSLDLDSDTTTPKTVDDDAIPTSTDASESNMQNVDEFTTPTPLPSSSLAMPDVDAIEENQTFKPVADDNSHEHEHEDHGESQKQSEKPETKQETGSVDVDQTQDLVSDTNTTPKSVDDNEIPTSTIASESESTESILQNVDEFTTPTPLPLEMPDVDAVEENQTFKPVADDNSHEHDHGRKQSETPETKQEMGNVDQSQDLNSDTYTTPTSVDDNEIPTSTVASESESTVQNLDEFTTTTPIPYSAMPDVDAIEENQTFKPVADDHSHEHGFEHHHHHHHDHGESPKQSDAETSSFIIIVKHLSSTLLTFLPEHLQDTVLDVDDALVFTGIIALTLVSICVPYFLIEGFFSVRPLKKKVVELNKSLWKVSTAYENQQEEFEHYKTKALAYDEDKKRVEQLEYELVLLQKLEGKQKEQVAKYNKELKAHKELTTDMQSFLDKEVEKKKKILEEKDKLKTTVTSVKEALRRTTDELQDSQLEASNALLELELSKQSNDTLGMKAAILEKEVNELKAKLVTEVERRRGAEDERDEASKWKTSSENELAELKKICMKYEETVSNLNTEIGHKENELMALQETLGEDSPLVDIAEVKAKLMNVEEETTSLQSRVDCLTLENNSLSRNLKESSTSLSTIQKERDEALNRLQVLESWFKEKEEDLKRAVERYEAERNIRGKDKDDLVRMIEEKSDENKELDERLEAFKEEFEETKNQHRNEIRTLEAKSHESWLSLCQAERKAQEARKEAEFLRQKLTALTMEKEGESGEVNGEVPMYLTPDMVPLPLTDDTPSYFGLGDGFIPPPPLPLDGEREPHRPAPLGRLSPNYSDLDDAMLSPIRRGARGGDDYSDGDSSGSDSPRRHSPRGGWVDLQHERDRGRNHGVDERRRRQGPIKASSPINQGFNL